MDCLGGVKMIFLFVFDRYLTANFFLKENCMIRKIGLMMLCLTALFTGNAFSAHRHLMTPNMSIDYEFPPNVAQVFSNFLFWTINAECVISAEAPVTKVSARASKKSSTVNGMTLPKDETLYFEFKDKDILRISADSGAEVELVNLSTKTIRARCSTV